VTRRRQLRLEIDRAPRKREPREDIDDAQYANIVRLRKLGVRIHRAGRDHRVDGQRMTTAMLFERFQALIDAANKTLRDKRERAWESYG
jgi:hypothetical protein